MKHGAVNIFSLMVFLMTFSLAHSRVGMWCGIHETHGIHVNQRSVFSVGLLAHSGLLVLMSGGGPSHTWIFNCAGAGAPNPVLFKAQRHGSEALGPSGGHVHGSDRPEALPASAV